MRTSTVSPLEPGTAPLPPAGGTLGQTLNAMLLTVGQRRNLIADLRLDGYTPLQIVRILLLDALIEMHNPTSGEEAGGRPPQ